MPGILVIVDMQEGFRFRNVERIVPRVKLLLDKFGANAIFTKFVDKKGSRFESVLGWKKFQEKSSQGIMKEFLTYAGNKTMAHNGLSIVTPELYEEIKRSNAKTVYLCGIYTDVSVSKAAMDLFDKGMDVKIISDAVTSQKGHHNRYFIESLGRVLGKQNIIKANDTIS